MYAIEITPVITRRRAREAVRNDATEPSPEAASLQEILAEMRTLRQEQTQMREEFPCQEEEFHNELRRETGLP